MSKVVELAPKNLRMTYLDAILYHIDQLSDEEKNAEVESLVICGLVDRGMMFAILHGTNVLEMVGILESTKISLYDEMTGGYDDL